MCSQTLQISHHFISTGAVSFSIRGTASQTKIEYVLVVRFLEMNNIFWEKKCKHLEAKFLRN